MEGSWIWETIFHDLIIFKYQKIEIKQFICKSVHEIHEMFFWTLLVVAVCNNNKLSYSYIHFHC